MTEAARRSVADRVFGLGWTGLGIAIAIGAWRMDRLENQGVEPYAVPGLVPGLLGVLLAAFGLALLLRRPRDSAVGAPGDGAEAVQTTPAEPWRVALALVLCIGFVVGALGHGPPFWLAAFLFLFLAILLFEWPDRRAEGTLLRGAAQAAAIAAVASALITYVFQELFLVRLP